MKLSEHFTLEEITFSERAAREGIDNTPNEEQLHNIVTYLVPGLEQVRAFLGVPMFISSGFRSLMLNAVTPGSSDTSAHCKGFAADWVAPAFGSPYDICLKLETCQIVIDQVIYEYRRWVHTSFDPRARALFETKLLGQPYQMGIHN